MHTGVIVDWAIDCRMTKTLVAGVLRVAYQRKKSVLDYCTTLAMAAIINDLLALLGGSLVRWLVVAPVVPPAMACKRR